MNEQFTKFALSIGWPAEGVVRSMDKWYEAVGYGTPAWLSEYYEPGGGVWVARQIPKEPKLLLREMKVPRPNVGDIVPVDGHRIELANMPDLVSTPYCAAIGAGRYRVYRGREGVDASKDHGLRYGVRLIPIEVVIGPRDPTWSATLADQRWVGPVAQYDGKWYEPICFRQVKADDLFWTSIYKEVRRVGTPCNDQLRLIMREVELPPRPTDEYLRHQAPEGKRIELLSPDLTTVPCCGLARLCYDRQTLDQSQYHGLRWGVRLIDVPVRRWVKWVNDEGEPRLIAAFEGERKVECYDPSGKTLICGESNYTKAWTGRYDVLIEESEYQTIRDWWTKVKAIELPLPPASDSWLNNDKLPLPPAGESWHNPDNVTADQLGVSDGWRLLLRSEVGRPESGNPLLLGRCDSRGRSDYKWIKGRNWGSDRATTYRTRLPLSVGVVQLSELQPIVRRIGDGPSGTILYSDYAELHKLAQL